MPEPEPAVPHLDDINVKAKTNWTMILIALIIAIGLAVVGHYVWTKTFADDDSGPVQFGD
jgi:hypothetical protein